MTRYLSLYILYLRIAIKVPLQYRADLWIGFVSTAIAQGMTILFISVIFTKIRVIEGWGFYEVVLIYGLTTASRYGSDVFLNMPMGLHWFIVNGDLDIVLVRPANALFQMIGSAGNFFPAIGHMAVGIAAIIFGLRGLDVQFHAWWTLYIPVVIVSGTVLFYAIRLMAASIGFWATNARSLIYPLSWFSDFAQFPAVVYPAPILIILAWVLPYAMMGFYPAAFMVRGGEYRVMGLIAPFMGWAFLGVSLLVWRAGIRRYESPGS